MAETDSLFQADSEHKRLEIERLRQEIDRYKEDTGLRRKYASCVYWFMVIYFFFMGLVVLTSGFCPKFQIDTIPLTTLIGGAFASAVGLVALVIKGLFPDDHKIGNS